jgi:hypothetical protein
MESDKTAAPPHESEKAREMEIVRIASYHRLDSYLAVVTTNPRDHDQMRSSLLRTIPATASTFGDLESLPPEVVFEICSMLDI